MPPFRIPRASGSIVVRNCIRRVFRLNTRGSMWFIVTIACVFVIMSVTVWTWRLNRIAPKQEDVAALFSISETESQTETDADIVIEESQPQVASQVVPVPVAVPVNSELELFAKGLRNTWYTREFTEIPRSVVIAAEKVEVKGVQKKYTINKKVCNLCIRTAQMLYCACCLFSLQGQSVGCIIYIYNFIAYHLTSSIFNDLLRHLATTFPAVAAGGYTYNIYILGTMVLSS